MKFEITHDKGTGVCNWVLATNSGELIASSSASYCSVEDAEIAINEFKKWVNYAYIEVVVREPVKDRKQQAKEQLKKTPWTKGQ